MRKFLIAGLAAAFFCGAPALAADMPVKAPPPPPVAVWTGFYGGLSLGARSAENDWTTTGFGSIAIAAGVFPGSDANQSFDGVAARIGGYTGYNWQVASTWVVGVEADIGWANNQKTKVGIPGTATATLGPHVTSGDTAFVNESWDGSIRARLGVLITPTTLLYASGGAAWQTIKIGATCTVNAVFSSYCTFPLAPTTHSESITPIQAGWTAGVGIEQRAWGNWFVRGEYQYADFGNVNHLFFGSDVGLGQDDRIFVNVKAITQTVTAGLAYRF